MRKESFFKNIQYYHNFQTILYFFENFDSYGFYRYFRSLSFQVLLADLLSSAAFLVIHYLFAAMLHLFLYCLFLLLYLILHLINHQLHSIPIHLQQLFRKHSHDLLDVSTDVIDLLVHLLEIRISLDDINNDFRSSEPKNASHASSRFCILISLYCKESKKMSSGTNKYFCNKFSFNPVLEH